MFSTPTVFVVGAGASCELGLPSGLDLKSDIAQLLSISINESEKILSGSPEILSCFNAIKKKQNLETIENLILKAIHIRDALPLAISIDNFLDAHSHDGDIERCGKLAISQAIINSERRSLINSLTNESKDFDFSIFSENWLGIFFQMLTEGVRKDQISSIFNNISLIVFNYDRCFERFIPIALAKYYGIDISESESICENLNIVHPYGQAGYLNWQTKSPVVPFGCEKPNLMGVSESIQTFAEGMRDADSRNNLEKILLEAETLVFLGFAFHPMNMDILKLTSEGRINSIFGTTFGLSEADMGISRNSIRDCFDFDNGFRSVSEEHPGLKTVPSLVLDSMKCRDFLVSYFKSVCHRS